MMGAETKKEKISKLFEMMGIENNFKEERDQTEEMFTVASGREMTKEEKNIIQEFSKKVVKVARECFEQIMDKRFKKSEIDKIIEIQTDPFFDRLDRAEKALYKKIQMKVDELMVEAEMKLSELTPFPGEDVAQA